MQKTKNADRRQELRAELTRVQQQIREEEARRQRQALDVERKVCTPPMLLRFFLVTDSLVCRGCLMILLV